LIAYYFFLPYLTLFAFSLPFAMTVEILFLAAIAFFVIVPCLFQGYDDFSIQKIQQVGTSSSGERIFAESIFL